MNDVSTLRLYVLRATYLVIAVGLGFMIWPGLIDAPTHLEHMRGVARALLGAVALLAVLGIRYPLQMLPLILFELTWKTIWVVAIGVPLWSAGALDADTRETWNDCVISVVVISAVIPWRYVWKNYVKRPADQWRTQPRFEEM